MAPCSTSIALHCTASTAWHIVCCAYRRIALRIIVNAAAYPYTCDNHKNLCCRKKTETTLNRGYDDREEDRRSKKCKTHVPVNLPCDLLYPRSGCAVVLSVCRLQTQTDDQFMDTWMASALWEEFYTHTPAPCTIAPYIKHLWISDNLLNVNMVIIFYVNKWWAIGIYRLWHI